MTERLHFHFEYSLALLFFWIGMQTDLFQSCGHCWIFQICWHIECSTFTASSFRIWNSSTGIPSPPLALFIVMLPKAHLTLHSRMSGSKWVITPPWLSGSWRSSLYSSSVYSCHLFLISSTSVRSIPFLSFIVPIFAWNVPLVSLIFLKRSLVFPIPLFSSFFALITEEGFLISPCYSLELCIQMGISLLFSFAFHFSFFFFSAICKSSPDNDFVFFHFFSWGWFWSLSPVQCHESLSIVLQALGLSDLIPWIYLSLPLYNHKEFDLGHTWMV